MQSKMDSQMQTLEGAFNNNKKKIGYEAFIFYHASLINPAFQ